VGQKNINLVDLRTKLDEGSGESQHDIGDNIVDNFN
jgi:hypothetical protein